MGSLTITQEVIQSPTNRQLLLLITAIQVCNFKKQLGQKDVKNVHSEEIKNTRLVAIAKHCAKRDKVIRERPDPQDLHCNKGHGSLMTRLHSAYLPTCVRKRPEKFSAPRGQKRLLQM